MWSEWPTYGARSHAMLEKLSPQYVRNALKYRLFKSRPVAVREAFERLSRELRAARLSRGTLSKFASLDGRTGLRLNLGCGPDVRPGWVNVDLDLDGAHAAADFYNYDLRSGLPLADGSASFIHSSHFFEHLSNRDGRNLLRECLRVLEPGGVLRLALPHYRPFFSAYLAGDWDYVSAVKLDEIFPDGGRNWGDLVDVGVYQYGEHVTYYDPERTAKILGEVGFKSVTASEFTPGLDIDTEERRRYSFYVEAVK